MSKLSRQELKQGFLGLVEFIIAMKLVSLAQEGHEITSDLLKGSIDMKSVDFSVLEGLENVVSKQKASKTNVDIEDNVVTQPQVTAKAHKAILELWRPKPTELTLFLTKGVDSTSIKVPPTAYPLTGSSDPCYIEAYHLADTNDGRVTLHLKIINLTELELNCVDIRVGLSGALYFMDGSPQAVRQLRNLVSQDPVQCSVTVGVSQFERCDFWAQVLYYPFCGARGDYDGDYLEEDPQIMKQKRGSKAELGEPVIVRCQPYKIPLTELLLPHKISPIEFFRLWPSLPAVAE